MSEISADDIVAVGGDFKVERLVSAYRVGVFPWPIEGVKQVVWFCPSKRAVLDFERLHISRSLEKARKKHLFEFSIDRCFEEVIRACAAERKNQTGTWITEELLNGYIQAHRAGYAHSVEVWNAEKKLVGGVYYFDVDSAVSAESMFHFESYASSLALLHLIETLAARGISWIDIQVITPHMEKMGAHLISREEFLERLWRAQESVRKN